MIGAIPMQKKILVFTSLILSDLVVIAFSYALAYQLRAGLMLDLFPSLARQPLPSLLFYFSHFYMALTWVLVFSYEKLYTKRFSIWAELKVLVRAATFSSFTIIIVIFLTRTEFYFSRFVVIVAWIISLMLFPALRILTKTLLIKFGIWKKKLIILGVHQTSLAVIQTIQKNKTMGYEVVAIIDDDPQKIGKNIAGIEILGPISRLEEITRIYQSKDIMVATPHIPRKKLKEILLQCEAVSDSMWLIPRSGDFITEGVEIDILGDILTLYIKRNLDKPWNILIKSLFEKFLTIVLLALASPIFALIALAIKMDSRGPVFFIQKRIGRKLKTFDLYKFRSMYLDNQKRLTDYLESHPEIKQEWEEFKKLKDFDPRVTRVGRLIRTLSLDELPQLINVLKDEMSLVGPRPYLPEEIDSKDQISQMISRVKPGITGPW
ncbi:MAG: exopolysaccharide biosynthesis polyprenyl glycosylphosphotransferase, partial [Candidatus Aminicenantes bacterium]|nr:exopolysaccharide biosynthesis polyprenyl glycosylphosphotransferase [Candidatus Aminicenantes bacterium]